MSAAASDLVLLDADDRLAEMIHAAYTAGATR
jgi:hypothetical protein